MTSEEETPHMAQTLRPLINLVDDLRDTGLHQYINLPQICVIGTQSAGKSSVLEAIVGMDFLPRGEGVVTRRPLELRLIHGNTGGPDNAESWATFEATGDKCYTDFDEVKRVIEQMTDEVAGKNKGIVSDPIVLTVHSLHCPDLTLIDLPGITRVPLKGSDQTDDIERLTREMTMHYAKDLRTIILAVVPANVDMTTSDALQIARKVDPRGLRTIGVITKIDLMDKGTDAHRMLLGEEVPLRLGYTGVRNRSQNEIKTKLPIAEAIKEEKRFFATHPVYRTLPPHLLGTQALIDKLTRVLFRHIRIHLPEIKKEINNRARVAQLRLDELGTGVPVAPQDKVQLMWSMITDYCELFRNTIRGKFDKKVQNYFEHHEITSGARIRSIFNNLLEEYVDVNVTADMQDHDIDLAIRMHEGDALPGFPSSDTFEYLILPHFKKIHLPVFECLDQVAHSLEALSQVIIGRIFNRFPRLSEQIMEKSANILLREKEITKGILENVVTAETGYLFTNDSHYLINHGSMLPMHEKMRDNPNGPTTDPSGTHNDASQSPPANANQANNYGNLSMNAGAVIHNLMSHAWTGASQDKKKTHYSVAFLKEIRSRLDAYFGIVLRNIRDIVPKIIGYFLVRRLQEKLQFELYNDFARAEHLTSLLGEPPHIMEERASLQRQITTLKKAAAILHRDPTATSSSMNEFDEMFDTDLAQNLAHATQNQAARATPKPVETPAHYREVTGTVPVKPYPNPQYNPAVYQSSDQNQSLGMPTDPGVSKSSGLWGAFANGSRPSGDTKNASLFGERQARAPNHASKIFVDAKIVNPLYS